MGLITLYVPTVIALRLISSDIHLVDPDSISSRNDSIFTNKLRLNIRKIMVVFVVIDVKFVIVDEKILVHGEERRKFG